MALIAIILSSTIGFVLGAVQFGFLGVPLWQAFVTYVAASIVLSTFIVGWSVAFPWRGRTDVQVNDVSLETLEFWHDWQAEEQMEAERLAREQEADERLPTIRRSA